MKEEILDKLAVSVLVITVVLMVLKTWDVMRCSWTVIFFPLLFGSIVFWSIVVIELIDDYRSSRP